MENLAALNIDYAMLCTDGIYNMNAAEAKEVAEIIKSKKYIPIHTFGSDISAFDVENQVRLKDGEEITL